MVGSRFRYLRGEQANAGGVTLRRLPIETEDQEQPIGELDGLVIDLADRQVKYLVVEAAETGRKHLLPLDATSLEPGGRALARVSSDELDSCEAFDDAEFGRYDDDALMALLFRRSAA